MSKCECGKHVGDGYSGSQKCWLAKNGGWSGLNRCSCECHEAPNRNDDALTLFHHALALHYDLTQVREKLGRITHAGGFTEKSFPVKPRRREFRMDVHLAELEDVQSQLAAANKVVENLRGELDASNQELKVKSAALDEARGVVERYRAAPSHELSEAGRLKFQERSSPSALDGWQWHPKREDTAFAPPFGTIRVCIGCGCLVAGGPTACLRCADNETADDEDEDHADPEADEDFDAILRERDELRVQLSESTTGQELLSKDLSEAHKRIYALQDENRTLKENAHLGSDTLRKERDAARAQLEPARSARNALEEEKQGLLRKLKTAERERDEVSRQLADVREKSLAHAQSTSNQQKQIWELEKERDAAKEEARAARADLREAKGDFPEYS